MIGRVLHEEVERADLKEEFERDLNQQEQIEKELLYSEHIDNEREAVGLTSLGSFENIVDEGLKESDFSQNVVELFMRLKNCYSILDELYLFYSDEFPGFISSIETDEIADFIRRWNSTCHEINDHEIDENIGGLLEILDTINSISNECDYSNLSTILPDSLNFGDSINFYCKDKNKAELVIEPLLLSVDDGGSDSIDIKLYDPNSADFVHGSIDIIYGFITYNDDGNVDNGCSEDITYDTDLIVNAIEVLVEELEEFVHQEEENINRLKEEFML